MCPLLAGLMKTMVNEAPVSEMKYLWNHQHALLSSRRPPPNHMYIHKHTPPPTLAQTSAHTHRPPPHSHLLVPPWVLVGWTRLGEGWKWGLREGVFFFFGVGGCLRVNCPSGGYQWTGQPSLLVSLVLNWQPGSDRLAASQEESTVQDTIKIITFSNLAVRMWLWVLLDVNKALQECVRVCLCQCVCVCALGGRWELAAGLGEDTARWGLFN